MATGKSTNAILIVLAIAVIVVIAFVFMGAKDNRSGGERIGDAIGELQNGQSPSEAVEQLEDRSPAEKAGDAIGDAAHNASEKIKESTD